MLKTSLSLVKGNAQGPQQEQKDKTTLKLLQEKLQFYVQQYDNFDEEKVDPPDARPTLTYDPDTSYQLCFDLGVQLLEYDEIFFACNSFSRALNYRPDSKSALAYYINTTVENKGLGHFLYGKEQECSELINTSFISKLEYAELKYCYAVILVENRKYDKAVTEITEQLEYLSVSNDVDSVVFEKLLIKAQLYKLQGDVFKKQKRSSKVKEAYDRALSLVSEADDLLQNDAAVCSTVKQFKLHRLQEQIYRELNMPKEEAIAKQHAIAKKNDLSKDIENFALVVENIGHNLMLFPEYKPVSEDFSSSSLVSFSKEKKESTEFKEAKTNSAGSKKRKAEENLEPDVEKRQKTQQKAVVIDLTDGDSKAEKAAEIVPLNNNSSSNSSSNSQESKQQPNSIQNTANDKIFNGISKLIKDAHKERDAKAFMRSIGCCTQAQKMLRQFAKQNNYAPLDKYGFFVDNPKTHDHEKFFELANTINHILLDSWRDLQDPDKLKLVRELSSHILKYRRIFFGNNMVERWEFLMDSIKEYKTVCYYEHAINLINDQLKDIEFMRTDNKQKFNLLLQKAELLKKEKLFDKALETYLICEADASLVGNRAELSREIILLQPTVELIWDGIDDPLVFMGAVFRNNRIIDLTLVGISFSDCKEVLKMLPDAVSLQTLTIVMSKKETEEHQHILLNYLLRSLIGKEISKHGLTPKRLHEVTQSIQESKTVVNQSLVAVHIDVSLDSNTTLGKILQQQAAFINQALTKNFDQNDDVFYNKIYNKIKNNWWAVSQAEKRAKKINDKVASTRRVGGTEIIGFKFCFGNTSFSHLLKVTSGNSSRDILMPDTYKETKLEVKGASNASTSRMMMELSSNNSSSSSNSNSSNTAHTRSALPKVTKAVVSNSSSSSNSSSHRQESSTSIVMDLTKDGDDSKPKKAKKTALSNNNSANNSSYHRQESKQSQKTAVKTTPLRQILHNGTNQSGSSMEITPAPNKPGSGTDDIQSTSKMDLTTEMVDAAPDSQLMDGFGALFRASGAERSAVAAAGLVDMAMDNLDILSNNASGIDTAITLAEFSNRQNRR